jgi:hypothetical protein
MMGQYTKLSEMCSARIYEAIFHSPDGRLEIKYGQDHFSHAYDPKPFLFDGYYIATYCLPSEKRILLHCFESEPFTSWKNRQLEIQTQNENAP